MKRTRRLPYFAVITGLAFWVGLGLWASATSGQDEVARRRPYNAGPLTKADFRGEVPESRSIFGGVPLRALLIREIQHSYKYRFTFKDGQYRLTVTEISVEAVMLTRRSWNADPEDADLLDHEQGHFDIAAISAAQLQAKLRGMAKRRELTAAGKDEAEGKQRLDERLKKILDDEFATAATEDRRYDSDTRHGTDRLEQARHRTHHRRLLRELKLIPEDEKRKP